MSNPRDIIEALRFCKEYANADLCNEAADLIVEREADALRALLALLAPSVTLKLIEQGKAILANNLIPETVPPIGWMKMAVPQLERLYLELQRTKGAYTLVLEKQVRLLDEWKPPTAEEVVEAVDDLAKRIDGDTHP